MYFTYDELLLSLQVVIVCRRAVACFHFLLLPDTIFQGSVKLNCIASITRFVLLILHFKRTTVKTKSL